MSRIDSYRPRDLTATDLEALEIELAERLTRRRFIIGSGVMLGAEPEKVFDFNAE